MTTEIFYKIISIEWLTQDIVKLKFTGDVEYIGTVHYSDNTKPTLGTRSDVCITGRGKITYLPSPPTLQHDDSYSYYIGDMENFTPHGYGRMYRKYFDVIHNMIGIFSYGEIDLGYCYTDGRLVYSGRFSHSSYAFYATGAIACDIVNVGRFINPKMSSTTFFSILQDKPRTFVLCSNDRKTWLGPELYCYYCNRLVDVLVQYVIDVKIPLSTINPAVRPLFWRPSVELPLPISS